MKALIPAAGLGTRFLPLSKAVPKEMVPVRGLPVLHHVVAEAKAAGCRQIGIILSAGKESIRRYFEWDQPLMDWLDRTGKRAAMAEWEALIDGLEFSWLDQPEQRGLGDAIACGGAFAAGDPVCVLLGDTIMEGGSPLPAMVRRHQSTGLSQVAVERIAREKATKYGVCWGKPADDPCLDLQRMIEKPSLAEMAALDAENGHASPEVFAFAARYLLGPAVFEILKTLPPGRNGEIQLTDAMAAVLEREGFGAVRLPGRRQDIGSPERGS